MYQGFYINLDRTVERRRQMEERLAEAGLADRYQRFPAIDGKTVTYGPEKVSGGAALGCTLSHLSLIKEQLDSGLHLHVLEDDVVLHKEIPRVFESFVNLKQAEDWDILMTDLFLPPDVYLFKFLHQKFKEMKEQGTITFLDIGDWSFAGAASYFVNKDSKLKFLQLAEHQFPPETPYDLRIRELAAKKALKVYTCFPFFSTLSPLTSDSTIAGDFQHVLPLSEYRRSFYVAPDLEGIRDSLQRFHRCEPDLHMEIFLSLIRSLIDPEHASF